MLEPDPTLFVFDYPVYLVLETKLKEQPEFVSLLNGDFRVPTTRWHGNKMMALFTDLDLAERFGASAGIPDIVCVRVGSRDELIDILLQAKVGKCEFVAFDPPGGGDLPIKQVNPIDEVLNALHDRGNQ